MAEGKGLQQITVVVCAAPRNAVEWPLQLPQGATVADALKACAALQPLPAEMISSAVGVWGRQVEPDCMLATGDRVEVYRPLKVDPKVARRQRFARQGARTTGLFARQRPGGKSGY